MASKLPKAIQVHIVQRFITGKDFDSFMQSYLEHSTHQKRMHEPSAKDLRIAALVKKEKSYKVVAKMVGVTDYTVMAAVGRVLAYR